MICYVVTIGYEYEGEEVKFASVDLEAAKTFYVGFEKHGCDLYLSEWDGARLLALWSVTDGNWTRAEIKP